MCMNSVTASIMIGMIRVWEAGEIGILITTTVGERTALIEERT